MIKYHRLLAGIFGLCVIYVFLNSLGSSRTRYLKRPKRTPRVFEEEFDRVCEYRYLGCLPRAQKINGTELVRFSDPKMTRKLCIRFCNLKQKTYAGIYQDTNCLCHRDIRAFADYLDKALGCQGKCSDILKDNCETEGETVQTFFVKQCQTVPLQESFLSSKHIGCFGTDVNPLSLRPVKAPLSSPAGCWHACNTRKRPLAAVQSDTGVCFCGQMTTSFHYNKRLPGCSKEERLDVYRTMVEDPRCELLQLLPLNNRRKKTGLVSFPGSGNTWTRHMIELATGFYSGCAYNEILLHEEGFLGELLKPIEGRVRVIKDHIHKLEKAEKYDDFILIIRNPYNAILAEFNRNATDGNHTGFATEKQYREKFPVVFKRLIGEWRNVPGTLLSSGKPCLVLFYEDMLLKPLEGVNRIAHFLVDKDQIPSNFAERLACLGQQLAGNYKRGKRKGFDPFTRDMILRLNGDIKVLRELLIRKGVVRRLPDYERELPTTTKFPSTALKTTIP